jgi:proteasome assembly chaperone (PAC2) family protein
MENAVKLWERPLAAETYMIVGWEQWADAGSISSGLPGYLVQKTGARRVGELSPAGFYLFQAPGTHHYLRPQVKLEAGYRKEMDVKKNEFFFAGDAAKGLVIFRGEEPHLDVDRHCDAILDVAQELRVRRVAALGGVYGSMPYDKDREVSCIYSLPWMKPGLEKYAVRFSDYEGGVTIGTYLAHRAEPRNIEVVVFYGFVPAYDFSQTAGEAQGLRIENDYRAWHELMRRLDHMFNLGIGLSDLRRQSEEVTSSMDAKIAELSRTMPKLRIKDYLAKIGKEFTETPFLPLDDLWERELKDIFADQEK